MKKKVHPSFVKLNTNSGSNENPVPFGAGGFLYDCNGPLAGFELGVGHTGSLHQVLYMGYM